MKNNETLARIIVDFSRPQQLPDLLGSDKRPRTLFPMDALAPYDYVSSTPPSRNLSAKATPVIKKQNAQNPSDSNPSCFFPSLGSSTVGSLSQQAPSPWAFVILTFFCCHSMPRLTLPDTPFPSYNSTHDYIQSDSARGCRSLQLNARRQKSRPRKATLSDTQAIQTPSRTFTCQSRPPSSEIPLRIRLYWIRSKPDLLRSAPEVLTQDHPPRTGVS